MANRTDPAAKSVHGTNPQNLVEKILRTKIYQNAYWKEQCFGLTAETLVDKAMELDHFGGTFGGNNKATPFMCLTLKMLQIQPDKEIVVEFIKNEDYKYVRVLGAFYLRLVALPTDVFHYLEPLYNDYRKLRRRLTDGSFALIHVDEFIDELLTKDYACDVSLPRLPKRWNLETSGQLEPRKSALEDDFEEEEEQPEEEEEPVVDDRRGRDRKRDYYRDKERERDPYDYDHGRGGRERERERDRDRDYYREKDRDRDYYHRRDRRRSRSRDRDRERDRDRDRDYYERSKRRRSASPEGRKRGRDDEKRKKEREKKAAPAVTDGTDHPDPEIAEANKLRAALGLKPLRP